MTFIQKLVFSSSIAITPLFTGCGGKSTDVAVASDAFNKSGSTVPASLVSTPATSVIDFKICVKEIELEDDTGRSRKRENQNEIEFNPGLIDLSSGTGQPWGTLKIPPGFNLSRIKVKVKKDQKLCGVDYSVKFNEQSTPEDIEFKWRFKPAIRVSQGDTLSMSLAEVVAALRTAGDEGTLASLKQHIERSEDIGKRD